MANGSDNLIPQAHVLTVEEQSAGGKASVEARRRKKDLRIALETLLEKDFTVKDKSGKEKTVSGTEAITTKLFEQAMKGNIRAFETIRDTVGQKPIEKLSISAVDQETIDEVEAMVYADDDDEG